MVFKVAAMTLIVRLDTATETALDRYCAERGVTKSLVVQESLAVYLLADAALPRQGLSTGVSENYKAFADAGLIGAVALGRGADKAGVRAQMAEHSAQRKARRGGA